MSLKPIDAATAEKCIAMIRQFDFEWWFKKRKVVEVRRLCEKQFGMRISPKKFVEMRAGACEWFKVQKRPRESTNMMLDANEWNRLRQAVKSQLHLIQGRTIEEAVAVVSLVCRCNAATLDGLTSELHVWNKATTQDRR